ncbi:hypothetical protein D3C77_398960 [compost metagenome]
MKKLIVFVPLLTALAASQAMATTVEMSVKGSVVPTSCTPSLSNGGEVDYGEFKVEDLVSFELPEQILDLSVVCSGNAQIGITAVDNVGGAEKIGGAHFGMGTHKALPIGSYSMVFESADIDSTAHSPLVSNDAGANWAPQSSVSLHNSATDPDFILSFGNSGAPASGTLLNATMKIQGSINPNLEFNDIIDLAGSSTIEIKYL